ncbi:HPP family protein [Aliiglaciecola sp. SL4]|uniref:HPP family protein n=1 Tax=Aliiglaciecola sp. SL4 TaxID=3239806 RepID=UPI00355B7F25
MITFLNELRLFLGLGRGAASLKEKMVSGATGMLGIGLIYMAGFELTRSDITDSASIFADSFMLIPIAATAVLLFCVPHGALSQPWPVIGGNFISAVFGIFCSQNIGVPLVSASIAVGGSILFMHFLRCIHPPGGATALTAVLGGDAVQTLGYYYALFPVLFSAIVMVAFAFALNFPFKWRRYPAHFFHLGNTLSRISPSQRGSEITLEDFIAAVNQHDSYIDLTDESWIELFELAKINAEKGTEHPESVKSASYYSNGQLGNEWEIRYIKDIYNSKRAKQSVRYLIVAGADQGTQGECYLNEFLGWARFEVYKKNGFWDRQT